MTQPEPATNSRFLIGLLVALIAGFLAGALVVLLIWREQLNTLLSSFFG